jgi:hypothetical protein
VRSTLLLSCATPSDFPVCASTSHATESCVTRMCGLLRPVNSLALSPFYVPDFCPSADCERAGGPRNGGTKTIIGQAREVASKALRYLSESLKQGQIEVRRTMDTSECGVETHRERLAGDRAAVVFHAGDTAGEPLPTRPQFERNPGEYLERLKALAAELGCSLEYSKDIVPARGLCSADKFILLPEMSRAEEFHVLTHEIAHSRLHFSARRTITTKCVRETEAEAVAFVVGQAIGLAPNSASWDYVKLYNGDKNTLAQSLEQIQRVSSEILSGITPP